MYHAPMDHRSIPLAAALGLSLTSCGPDDPSIVGTWDATEVDGQKFPVVQDGYDTDYTYTSSLFLVIKDDLTGTLTSRESITDNGKPVDSYEYSYSVAVDDDDAPTYKLNIPDGELALICTLSGSALDCTDADDGEFHFKKR